MQRTDIEALKTEFSLMWCDKVQRLTQVRATKMTQSEMAFMTGKSLRTIQRFERYECVDPELMYIYNSVLK